MRGQRHAPAALCPLEGPGTHCTGGWVGPRAGLDCCGKSRPTGIRSPDRPAGRQSLYRLRYPAHGNLMCRPNITIYSLLLLLLSKESCCLKFSGSTYCANELVRIKTVGTGRNRKRTRVCVVTESLVKPAKVRSSDSRMWAGWARR